MVLYFFRHGSAGPAHADTHTDQHRSLDRDGVRQCELMGKALAAMGAKLDFVVSSPLRRARQSAQLIAWELGFGKRIRLSSALLPHGSYQEFLRLLSKFKKEDRLLLVGHNSRLSDIVGKLISPAGARARIYLKKGGVAKVRWGPKGARLQWSINPSLLIHGVVHAPPRGRSTGKTPSSTLAPAERRGRKPR